MICSPELAAGLGNPVSTRADLTEQPPNPVIAYDLFQTKHLAQGRILAQPVDLLKTATVAKTRQQKTGQKHREPHRHSKAHPFHSPKPRLSPEMQRSLARSRHSLKAAGARIAFPTLSLADFPPPAFPTTQASPP